MSKNTQAQSRASKHEEQGASMVQWGYQALEAPDKPYRTEVRIMTAPDGLYIASCPNISLRQLPTMPDQCWEWTGRRSKKNYGSISFKGTEYSMHRLFYRIFVGELYALQVVRHKCDNPPCCNPSHLIKGTPADNVADCCERFRNAFGDRAGNRTLTADAVLAMRNEYALGNTSQPKLAVKYGVSKNTVRFALIGHTWAHVKGPLHPKRPRPTPFLLSEEQARLVRAVYQRRVPGYTMNDLANYFGVKKRSILKALKRTGHDNQVPFSQSIPEDAPWIAVSTNCVRCLEFKSCVEIPEIGWLCAGCMMRCSSPNATVTHGSGL